MQELENLKSPLVKYFKTLLGPLIENTEKGIKFNKTDSTKSKSLDDLLSDYTTVDKTLSENFMSKVD